MVNPRGRIQSGFTATCLPASSILSVAAVVPFVRYQSSTGTLRRQPWFLCSSTSGSKRTTTHVITMKNSPALIKAAVAAVAAIILCRGNVWVDAFAPPTSSRRTAASSPSTSCCAPHHHHVVAGQSLLAALNESDFITSENDNDNNGADLRQHPLPSTARRSKFLSIIRQKTKPITLALLTAVSTSSYLQPRGGNSVGNNFLAILPAEASAPIVLRAAQKKDDPPMIQALKKAQELKKQRSLEEFDAFMAQANDIESSQGKAARATYEAQYQRNKAQIEAQKARDILLLKRQLLDAGQDPHTDLDAERQVFLLEHNVDLEKISGTPQNERMIKNFQKRGKNMPTFQHQRYIIACQVSDLKARGIDPMEYFAQPDNMQKTRSIYKMDDSVAERVAKQYESLMKEYGGRLTPKKEGEVPFVYPDISTDCDDDTTTSLSSVLANENTKNKLDKAAMKAKRDAEKEALRQARAEAKAKSKADRMESANKAKAERAAEKEKKLAEKAAAKAVAASTSASATAGGSTANVITEKEAVPAIPTVIEEDSVAESIAVTTLDSSTTRTTAATSSSVLSSIQSKATLKNIGTVVIGGGVATYAYNYFQENNAGAQKERERQLRLILGKKEEEDDDEDEDEDDDEDDDVYEPQQQRPSSKPKLDEAPKSTSPTPIPVVVPPPSSSSSSQPPKQKKKLGIFSKRNADARETNLDVLIGPNSQAPEFAKLLAQILTFGAPGRFPKVTSWSSTPMPMEKFDLDTAKSLIIQSREDAGLTDEDSAELFASVVNCMVIDIVDLASSTVKGKDKNEKVAVDAINVVMDFMDHAASLFDAVAKDVTIKPVTYGGNLRKKDLEQMFSIYAGSSMLSLDGTGSTQDRVDTLQLVFAISDKKAEGLMQKHMMKMMMNLMKDGGKGLEGMPGMEGMEEMMKVMGGGGGLPGMPGMDGDISPEDLKQTLGMMKDMMDSGQVSQEELVEVRKQFKEMYGSDISDLIKKASEDGAGEGMTDDERELLDVFKQLLGDD